MAEDVLSSVGLASPLRTYLCGPVEGVYMCGLDIGSTDNSENQREKTGAGDDDNNDNDNNDNNDNDNDNDDIAVAINMKESKECGSRNGGGWKTMRIGRRVSVGEGGGP